MLKVLELFCGAGSFSVQLNELGVEHEIVGFSDIRKNAIDLFCKIHGTNPEDNLGDVKLIDATNIDVDLLVFGSPCQSFSRTGKSEGGVKGSNTKSSLMWESVRIMTECNPKWIVWENVPDAISKKHKPNFEAYMEELDEMGYNTYYSVLMARDLGSAQKRKRLFAVSVRKDIDNGEMNFDYESATPRKLEEYLEDEIDERLIVEDKVKDVLLLDVQGNDFYIKNATKQGWLIANEGDAIDFSFPSSETRRGRVQKQACQTLLRSKSIGTIKNGTLVYLSPFEYWKLQEMPIELYDKVKECEFSLDEEFDVVGGVINQKHLEVVLGNMKKVFNW